MNTAGYALFVARSTYRQRRMIDAAGLLPILGALLFALPLLWLGGGAGPGLEGQNLGGQGLGGQGLGGQGGPARTSHVMIYVFAVWAGLAILSALITRGLHSKPGATEEGMPELEDSQEISAAPYAGPGAHHGARAARDR